MNDRVIAAARILEQDPNPVLEIDRNGMIVFCNPACEEVLGGDGYRVGELLPEPTRTAALESLDSGLKQEKEARVGEKVISFTVVPACELGSVDLFGYDMTKRKREEDQERRQKELLEAIFNAMTEAVTIFDAQGNLTRMNAPAEHYYRSTGENDLDALHQILRVFDADGKPLTVDEMPVTRALRGEIVRDFQLRYMNAEDEIFDVVTSAAPLYQHGEMSGAVVVWRNVTDREDLYRQLQGERALLKAVLEQMPAGVLIAEVPSRRIVMSNSRADEILRQFYSQEEDDPQGPLQGLRATGEPYRTQDWPLERSIQAGEVIHGEEIQIQRADGTFGTLSVNSGPVYDPLGKTIASVQVTFDISDRKQEEKNNLFLKQFGEKLLQLVTPEEIRQYATHSLGQYLHANHCLIDEVDIPAGKIRIVEDFSPKIPSLVGQYQFTRFHDEVMKTLKRDQILTVSDALTDQRTAMYAEVAFLPTGMRSMIAVPFFKDDQWRGTLTTADDQPRVWRPDEIALLHSAANMLWLALEVAELVQNLEQITRRFEVALKNAPVSVYTLDRNLRFTWVYKPPFQIQGTEMIGKRDDELLLPDEAAQLVAVKRHVLETGQGTRMEIKLTIDGIPHIYDITLEPTRTVTGEVFGLAAAWIDITGLRKLEAEMRLHAAQIEIQRQILRHRELERQEIARDLHDGLLQELIGINFLMNDLDDLEDIETLLETSRQVQETVQEQIRELRAFCSELRPPTLAPFGLEKAINSHLDGFREKHPDLNVSASLQRDGKAIPEEIRLALFRVYQEALNNIVRHSGATEVEVKLFLDPNQILLEIADNGKGFQVPQQWVTLAREGHLGLVGMNERVQAIDGVMTVESQENTGTRIQVMIPLGREKEQ